MSEFPPVATLAEFMLLDEGEVLEGYFDGFHDAPRPTRSRSRSYWHGWRTGQIDCGILLPDAAHEALAAESRQLAAVN